MCILLDFTSLISEKGVINSGKPRCRRVSKRMLPVILPKKRHHPSTHLLRQCTSWWKHPATIASLQPVMAVRYHVLLNLHMSIFALPMGSSRRHATNARRDWLTNTVLQLHSQS